MRPRHHAVRDQLPALLRRHPGSSSSELADLAGTSPATMVRALKELAAQIVRVGKAGRTRYYLMRALRGQTKALPLYRIDSAGQAAQLGQLQPLAPEGCFLDVKSLGWPVPDEFAQGVWPGLPYPLQDMWPQGFLGRSFARHVAAEFDVSDNPSNWREDEVLQVLAQRGSDCTGDLMVGDVALRRWLQLKVVAPPVVAGDVLPAHYESMAEQATSVGLVGASAAGEFPKFTALRALEGCQSPHVMVKFSGCDNSGAVRRWSDLLVCEHLALESIAQLDGIRSAFSRVLQSGGRTFLEVERFDRHGLWGRSPLCSLATLAASIIDKSSDNWVELAQAMVAGGWLNADGVRQMRLISFFGLLIQNTDMHLGNMSFIPGAPMQLAPVYDMLPMAYAPLGGGELPSRAFAPRLPMPNDRDIWLQAGVAALAFWRLAAQDGRISDDFQAICQNNAQTLQRLLDLC
ncbi:MAG: type II toxin-antitoxin system HipA family toxin YjjJ [Gammaproteobacteria bacterium]|uniref:type II toxin-antitoxin system HipA family toxin YjjJ n=1 Tax=Rhodoferax sp. TaxID=50421 RepID=UPI0017C9F701|nr:type II toxin-antitoxin system HipA family toxin YjjJ [Rhodoferax sp.]MBU3900110.1 type II toxin-antitoxin system HipA family toxin YjjJ [Gammaproteobacteria bacterium]MBA3059784.1 type II toxin-antitoxin system HipA family toxin YjjJ [Rhodoferax sp.]MBU3998737.1 type II toxin-antitoxin system HipA family toxin YjjJ [Gammaproteobacteria bacterium]MBU4018294.1 type II toxin-antitoxin system HipA family toxin YjjJ [Gammaproteobacteria bacterium]MBU4082148.1 type II toxin-antitoxin system HipA